MEQTFIKLLDENSECVDCRVKGSKIIITAKSIRKEAVCPYCGGISSRIHSVYQREIPNITMQDKQTILLLNTRKMFCVNEQCSKKTFSERFDFISSNEKKTKQGIPDRKARNDGMHMILLQIRGKSGIGSNFKFDGNKNGARHIGREPWFRAKDRIPVLHKGINGRQI